MAYFPRTMLTFAVFTGNLEFQEKNMKFTKGLSFQYSCNLFSLQNWAFFLDLHALYITHRMRVGQKGRNVGNTAQKQGLRWSSKQTTGAFIVSLRNRPLDVSSKHISPTQTPAGLSWLRRSGSDLWSLLLEYECGCACVVGETSHNDAFY